ncbi:MATE family efflux transporter [Elioraea sp.]|uniref:MATE family efflux transporter n=1 Tax=Elioraea sp. TaxID=2185103 RepID=UPI0021DCF0EC|nr:MATE family efflux transporter [Elioraea sp.]GIX08694.1 MAG: MATE family efflux transporter [Elioraea sp.]
MTTTALPVRAAAGGAWLAEIRATLALAWPIALTNLSQMAMGITDAAMLGNYDAVALAASAIGLALYWTFAIAGLGLAFGTAPLMAQALGRRRHAVRDVRRSARMGLWATAGFALPASLVLWQAEAILLLLGQDAAIAAPAGLYVRTLLPGLLPFWWFMVLRSFVSALERPKPALVATMLAIPLNGLLDWLFIFGRFGLPELGIVGAGLASAASMTTMMALLLGVCVTDRQFRRYALLGRLWRLDRARMAELLRVSLPIVGALLFEVMVFNAAVLLVGWIDAVSVAAHAIAIQCASLTFMVPMGIAQAATVRVGLAAGACDRAGVGRAGWTALALGGAFMGAMALVFLAAPRPIVALFLDPALPAADEVAALAARLLMVAGLFQVVDGMQVIGAGALRGLKDTRVPMLYAGLGYWVLGLPFGAALAFGAGIGAIGIWFGLAFGLAVVAVLLVLRWSRREVLGIGGVGGGGAPEGLR